MRGTVFVGIACCALINPACSSSTASTAALDGGGAGEAGGDDAGADSSAADGCGAAPYVSVGVMVQAASSGGKGAPIDGATFTASICPGVSLTTAPDGSLTALVSKGTPFYAHIEAANYVRSLTAETQFDADASGFSIPLPPKIFTALIPNYAADQTYMFVGVTSDGGPSTCRALSGITIDVPGHTEASVAYLTADAIPQVSPGTSTTAAGLAIVSGLAPDQLVSLHGAKAGCTVTFAKPPYTGRAPLEAGSFTLVPATVH